MGTRVLGTATLDGPSSYTVGSMTFFRGTPVEVMDPDVWAAVRGSPYFKVVAAPAPTIEPPRPAAKHAPVPPVVQTTSATKDAAFSAPAPKPTPKPAPEAVSSKPGLDAGPPPGATPKAEVEQPPEAKPDPAKPKRPKPKPKAATKGR